VDCIGAAKRLRSCFAQTYVTDFPLLDEPRHCAYRVFDRHLRIDPVQVVKIDVIGFEPPQ
jgi:hypothetical protein